MSSASFTQVFTRALLGEPCTVLPSQAGSQTEPQAESQAGAQAGSQVLPVSTWSREADADDLAMLGLCRGATVDIGCGPGRLTAALAERGHVVLGIDVVPEAVGQTRGRGAVALRRDVFDEVPGEGRWWTALLADGNLGIGGDPVALLRRVRELLDPRGRAVVEVVPPGVPSTSGWASITCGDVTSRPFRWAVVGVDDIGRVAAEAGFVVVAVHRHGARWSALLEESA